MSWLRSCSGFVFYQQGTALLENRSADSPQRLQPDQPPFPNSVSTVPWSRGTSCLWQWEPHREKPGHPVTILIAFTLPLEPEPLCLMRGPSYLHRMLEYFPDPSAEQLNRGAPAYRPQGHERVLALYFPDSRSPRSEEGSDPRSSREASTEHRVPAVLLSGGLGGAAGRGAASGGLPSRRGGRTSSPAAAARHGPPATAQRQTRGPG